MLQLSFAFAYLYSVSYLNAVNEKALVLCQELRHSDMSIAETYYEQSVVVYDIDKDGVDDYFCSMSNAYRHSQGGREWRFVKGAVTVEHLNDVRSRDSWSEREGVFFDPRKIVPMSLMIGDGRIHGFYAFYPRTEGSGSLVFYELTGRSFSIRSRDDNYGFIDHRAADRCFLRQSKLRLYCSVSGCVYRKHRFAFGSILSFCPVDKGLSEVVEVEQWKLPSDYFSHDFNFLSIDS